MVARKVAVIGLCATIILAAATLAAVILLHNKKNSDHNQNIVQNQSQKVIKDLCQNTYYQQTCIDTLSKATNSSDPKTLIALGFQTAILELGHVINQTQPLQEAANNPKTAGAYKTCQKLLDDSIYDLDKTIGKINSFDITDFRAFIDDIKTWLTGALTYQETCLDCFEEANDKNAGDKMEKLLKLSREITINGLALVNEFSNEKSTNDTQRTPRSLLQAGLTSISPNVIVAQDGSGKYKTINEALLEAPQKCNETFVIYIKEGVYHEYVTVNMTTWSVMFIGDGPTKTKVIGNRSKIGTGHDTFWSSTVAIEGDNFIARDMGFENSAGPDMHQAVAVRVSADKTIFHNCQIDGFQDTLYAHNHRQYYRDCTISGTIDFIFGNARTVLQNCTLVVRKPLATQRLCMVTAQGRTLVNETSAVVLQNCRVVAGLDYPVEDKSYLAFLGRPWKEFSTVIVMDSEIGGFISPSGWSAWNETSAHLDTCWYAEVDNKGPGADLTRRVKWPGFKRVSIEEAEMFTPGRYMMGNEWIAGKGVPYDSGRRREK
ncbi:hypothetical protein CASFOL_030097 [Castilleja foliolosa]|uniref:Pectinesterase n=1 Tax=Castilleja foliolosa TaxID=1961234 RepID=A0ABD3C9N1_9LAMI